MSLLKEYTEADLKKLFSGLIRKPITDRMMDVLIAHTYNRNPNNRSSGFYYPGGLDAILTWDDINRILSLEPVIPDVDVYDKNGDLYVPHFRFYSWYQGPVLHRIYEKMELELPDEEGLYMIFFGVDQEEREWVLQFIKNPEAAEIAETYTTGVIVAWIYWHENNNALYVGDSRHGSEWNPAFHWTWHQTLNSQRQSGLTFENISFDGDGSEDEHFQFGISAGKIWHDDIYAETEAVGALNALPVWHFLSGLPRIISQPNRKFLTHGSGRLAFHTGAQFQEAQDGWFVAYHYFATNCKKEPVIAAVANNEHETLAAAVGSIAADLERVKSQLPHKQLLHIGSIIYQTSDEYENSAKTRIVWSTGTVDTFVTELEFDDNTRTLTLRQNNNKEDLTVEIPCGEGGGGGDAREIELDISSGWVVWRYVGDENWQQLFKIPSDGEDGREIQIRTNAGYVEWKYDDEISWTQLFKIPVDGSDGKEIELRENAGWVEWRYVDAVSWTQLFKIPSGGGGEEYSWNIHTPAQIIGYINEPAGLNVNANGSGSVDESYQSGDIQLSALNENGETLTVPFAAFDVLDDTTSVMLSWNSVDGATGYRIYYDGNYHDVSGTSFDFLNFSSDGQKELPEKNTAAIFQNAFEIKNEDTVQFVGKGVDVETEIAENDEDENDTSKKIVHIIKQQSDWDEDDVENPNFIKNKPKSVSSYTYVAYASDNSGTGFSLTPTDSLKYRAEIHVTEELDPPAESDFSGATWVKYIGEDGGGGGFDCADLLDCGIIQQILNTIGTISDEIVDTPGTAIPPVKVGYYYNFMAANDPRLPAGNSGFILPSENHWKDLGNQNGGYNNASNVLKDTDLLYWDPANTNTNLAEFFARGGGEIQGSIGNSRNWGIVGSYWSSTIIIFPNSIRFLYFLYNTNKMNFSGADSRFGFNIRLCNPNTLLSDGEKGTYIGNNGTIYPTKCYGTIEWMTVNLKETKFSDGSEIPSYSASTFNSGFEVIRRGNYNDDPSNA